MADKISIYEQGLLAVDAYESPPDRGKATNSWEKYGDHGDKAASGLKIQAYRNGDHIHIAVGGTDTSSVSEFWKDTVTDTAFITGELDPQFKEALEYVAKVIDQAYKSQLAGGFSVEPPTFTVSGHSLGGGIAQMISYVFGIPGISLDAPGVSKVVANPEFQAYVAELRERYGPEVVPPVSKVHEAFTNYNEDGAITFGGGGPRPPTGGPAGAIAAGRAWLGARQVLKIP